MEQSPKPTIAAGAPFDGSFANIILRSSDNVDFYVYKEILIIASEVFRDMFDIPQPPMSDRNNLHPESGHHIISVTEPSSTLDPLLRLCYPIADPIFMSAEVIGNVIGAAAKYAMRDALSGKLEDRLECLVNTVPIEVYAVACYLGLDDIAASAAESSCSVATFPYDSLFDRISAGALFRLLERRRGHAAHAVQKKKGQRAKVPRPPRTRPPMMGKPAPAFPVPQPIIMPLLHSVRPSDIVILRSRDGPDNHIHAYHLAIFSSVLSNMLPRCEDDPNTKSANESRCLVLPESPSTVAALLQCCDPSGVAPPMTELLETGRFLVAAKKYEIARAISYARDAWVKNVAAQPLRAYFIAMENGWEAEAIEPAHQLLFQNEIVYVPEMEEATAKTYHRLLAFKKAYLQQQLLESAGDSDCDYITGTPDDWSHCSYNCSNDSSGLLDYLMSIDHSCRPFTMSDQAESERLQHPLERGAKCIAMLAELSF